VEAFGAGDAARMRRLRDRLEARLQGLIPGLRRNGARARRVCSILSVTLPGVSAAALLQALSRDGVCASAGSACSSGQEKPSHVLLALGRGEGEAKCTVRLSLGRFTTAGEVDGAARAIARLARRAP